MMDTHITSLRRLRQAIQVIEDLAPQEIRRFSQRRKRHLENAYAILRQQAGKLQVPLAPLSTYYCPQQYLDNVRALVYQIALQDVPQILHLQNQPLRVQPELGEDIRYDAFHSIYHVSPEELHEVIELVKRYRPDLPILNCTIERVILRQRAIRGQDLLDQEVS